MLLGVGDDIVYGKDDCPITRRQFVYTECNSQLLHALSGDLSFFLERLKMLPEFKYLENIEVFRDPEKMQQMRNVVQEYGFNLWQILHVCVGLENHADYLLETAGEDLLVLSRITYS